jgi:hypothetical protein
VIILWRTLFSRTKVDLSRLVPVIGTKKWTV